MIDGANVAKYIVQQEEADTNKYTSKNMGSYVATAKVQVCIWKCYDDHYQAAEWIENFLPKFNFNF